MSLKTLLQGAKKKYDAYEEKRKTEAPERRKEHLDRLKYELEKERLKNQIRKNRPQQQMGMASIFGQSVMTPRPFNPATHIDKPKPKPTYKWVRVKVVK